MPVVQRSFCVGLNDTHLLMTDEYQILDFSALIPLVDTK
jgi:hypothetical protein